MKFHVCETGAKSPTGRQIISLQVSKPGPQLSVGHWLSPPLLRLTLRSHSVIIQLGPSTDVYVMGDPDSNR